MKLLRDNTILICPAGAACVSDSCLVVCFLDLFIQEGRTKNVLQLIYRTLGKVLYHKRVLPCLLCVPELVISINKKVVFTFVAVCVSISLIYDDIFL